MKSSLRSGSSDRPRMSGEVRFEASPNGGNANGSSTADSRIYLESGSSIDVSGEFVDLPAERNALTVRLQGSELRDSPVQRDSALRGQVVTVDVRRRGTTADGRPWVGTPLADLNEASQGVRRTVGERSSTGGTVNVEFPRRCHRRAGFVRRCVRGWTALRGRRCADDVVSAQWCHHRHWLRGSQSRLRRHLRRGAESACALGRGGAISVRVFRRCERIARHGQLFRRQRRG